jgi:hypothetical protein
MKLGRLSERVFPVSKPRFYRGSGHLTGTLGQVLWTRGTLDINEMPKIGLAAPEFLEKLGRK